MGDEIVIWSDWISDDIKSSSCDTFPLRTLLWACVLLLPCDEELAETVVVVN